MSAPLADFFATMRPFLLGTAGLPSVQAALGTSPSRDEDLAFYRVLVERNYFKVLGELFGPLRTLIVRDPDGHARWTALARAYLQAHRPAARHPDGVGEAFPAFLVARREREPSQPASWEELADYCWIRHRVRIAPDGDDDGFDRRLFVRQYTHPVPAIVHALRIDPSAALPEAQPVFLLVYRHWTTLEVRSFLPSAAGLVALARRQGAPVPAPLQSMAPDHVAAAERQLVAHGVLRPGEG